MWIRIYKHNEKQKREQKIIPSHLGCNKDVDRLTTIARSEWMELATRGMVYVHAFSVRLAISKH
jgi:hypothetical protein